MRKISFFPALLVVVFASCSKTPKETYKGCLITQIKATGVLPTGTSLDVYRLQYTNIGTLEKVEMTTTQNGVTTDSVRHFKLGKGYVVVDHFRGNPGVLYYRDSIVFNKDNRILAIYTTLNNPSMMLSTSMSYDAEGQLKNWGAGYEWQWTNGDISTLRMGNEYTNYEYYDTAYNVGIIRASYDDLTTYGGILKKRTRLLKTAKERQVIYDYTYQLDKEGKIEKWYERSRDGQSYRTYEYTYDCK